MEQRQKSTAPDTLNGSDERSLGEGKKRSDVTLSSNASPAAGRQSFHGGASQIEIESTARELGWAGGSLQEGEVSQKLRQRLVELAATETASLEQFKQWADSCRNQMPVPQTCSPFLLDIEHEGTLNPTAPSEDWQRKNETGDSPSV